VYTTWQGCLCSLAIQCANSDALASVADRNTCKKARMCGVWIVTVRETRFVDAAVGQRGRQDYLQKSKDVWCVGCCNERDYDC